MYNESGGYEVQWSWTEAEDGNAWLSMFNNARFVSPLYTLSSLTRILLHLFLSVVCFLPFSLFLVDVISTN